MDEIRNPLVGSWSKRPEKSLLLTGLRGVGKTVLLNEIERIAIDQGFRTILVEAHEGKPLAVLLAPHLRSLLFDLDRLKGLATRCAGVWAAISSRTFRTCSSRWARPRRNEAWRSRSSSTKSSTSALTR